MEKSMRTSSMELHVIPIRFRDDINLILGQSHFIKSVEDLHEALVGSMPGIRFGLAFAEASGKALVRWSGTDDDLAARAREMMLALGTGHTFLILLGNAFPINVLAAVKAVPEVCHIDCATANPIDVVVAETELGRGIVGVIDGVKPVGVETEVDITERKELLRSFGYKAG